MFQKSSNLTVLSSIFCRFLAAMQYFSIQDAKVLKYSFSFSLCYLGRLLLLSSFSNLYQQLRQNWLCLLFISPSCCLNTNYRVLVCYWQNFLSCQIYCLYSFILFFWINCTTKSYLIVFQQLLKPQLSFTLSTNSASYYTYLMFFMQTEFQKYTSRAVSLSSSFYIWLAVDRSLRASTYCLLLLNNWLLLTQCYRDMSRCMSLVQSDIAQSNFPCTVSNQLLFSMDSISSGLISICQLRCSKEFLLYIKCVNIVLKKSLQQYLSVSKHKNISNTVIFLRLTCRLFCLALLLKKKALLSFTTRLSYF